MVYKPKKIDIKVRILKILELLVHMIILIIIPFVYLDFTTGFDQYKLPEVIANVYWYWLIYLILIPVIYHLFTKLKK